MNKILNLWVEYLKGCILKSIIKYTYIFQRQGGGFMFSDELAKIVNSEEEAENLVKDAKAAEKKILEDAKSQADGIIEDAEKKGKDYYQEQIEEGNHIAKTNYDNFIEDVKKQNRELQSNAEGKLDEVSDFIFERIVNSRVNS